MSCQRYRVKGLVSRPELNGMILPSVVPSSPSDVQELLEKGRILVAVFPAPIAVKKENLTLIDESDPNDARVDWSFSDTPPVLTVLDALMKTDIGLIDQCDSFVDRVICCLTQSPTPPRLPIAKLDRSTPDLQSGILNTPGHCIYFFYLNQIAQKLVLETHCGKARLYLSVIKDRIALPVVSGQPDIKIGYSAREWASAKPQDRWQWPDEMKAAHARWGGGRELSRVELEAFLAHLFVLQDCAEALCQAILVNLPDKSLRAAQEAWEKRFAATCARERGKANPGSRVEVEPSPIGGITHAYASENAARCFSKTMTIPAQEDMLHLYSNERAASIGLPPFELFVEGCAELVLFNKAYMELVGIYPPPHYVYLNLLNHRHWKDTAADYYGSSSGWAFSVVTIPH